MKCRLAWEGICPWPWQAGDQGLPAYWSSGSSVLCSNHVFIRASGQSWLTILWKACAHLEPMNNNQNWYEMKNRFLKIKYRKILAEQKEEFLFLNVSVCLVSVCLHVCRHMCVQVHMHMLLLSYGSLRLISGVLLDCHHMLRHSLSLNLELTFLLVWLPSFLQGSSTSAPHTGITCRCNAHLLPLPPTLGLHAGAMPTWL